MTIAENIKKIREQYGLTQAELGEIAGVSDKAVSTWENGTAEPRMGAIQKIAEHFGITKGSIVDDKDQTSGQNEGYYFDDEAAELAQEIYEDPELRVLLKAKRDLSKDDMEVIVNMIKALQAKDGK